MYLALPGNAEKSDRSICEELKVHHRDVSEGRKLFAQSLANQNSTAPVGAVEYGQADEPKKRIGKDRKARTVKPKEPKSPRKPDKEPPAFIPEQSREMQSRLLNGHYDGRKTQDYIDAISKYAKIFTEFKEILETLPGLIGTVDQQQAADTAVQSIIEPCNQCHQAVHAFYQNMQTRSDISAQDSSLITDESESQSMSTPEIS